MAGPINLKLLTNFFNKIGPEPPRLRLMAGGFRGYFGRDRDEAARPTSDPKRHFAERLRRKLGAGTGGYRGAIRKRA